MTKEYWPGLMFEVFNLTEYKKFFHHSLEENIGEKLLEEEGPFIVVKDETQFNYIQASDFLNVPYIYFKREVAAKLAPEPEDNRWGAWRCLYKDLAAFRKQKDKERDEGMQELMELEQEMGLYD